MNDHRKTDSPRVLCQINLIENNHRLRKNTLYEVLSTRLGTYHKENGLKSTHFTAKFVRKNMERAATMTAASYAIYIKFHCLSTVELGFFISWICWNSFVPPQL